jgi:hypothetical protein
MHESTVHTNTKNTLLPPTASLERGEKFRLVRGAFTAHMDKERCLLLGLFTNALHIA